MFIPEVMFKNLFKGGDEISIPEDIREISPEDKFFPGIVGYSDIKRLFLKSIIAKQPVHILLSGPPASSKTVFLLEILEGLNNAYFTDASGTSGPGIIDYLFSNDVDFLLIDEIDKMKKNDQVALLNIMETGILSETKLKGKTRQKKMKLWVFATSNNVEKLSNSIRSRFMELHLEEYSYDQFVEISQQLLKERYQLATEIAERTAYLVWNRIKSKDIRDVLRIARLTNSLSDVDWLVDVQIKYGNSTNNYMTH